MTQAIHTTADMASRALFDSPMMLQTSHTYSTSQILCVLYPLTILFQRPFCVRCAAVSCHYRTVYRPKSRTTPWENKAMAVHHISVGR